MIVAVYVSCRAIALSFSAFYLHSLITVLSVDLLKSDIDHIKKNDLSIISFYEYDLGIPIFIHNII